MRNISRQLSKTILIPLFFFIIPFITHSAFVSFPSKIDTIQERINIQVVLNRVMVPSPNLKIDGILGKKSIQAIQAFQESRGLVADGKVGPITRSALESAQTGTSITPSYTSTNTTTYTTGCFSGALFNTLTGQPCTTNQSYSSGCEGNNKYNTLTGTLCTTNDTTSGGGSTSSSSSSSTTCSGSTLRTCSISNGQGYQSRDCNSGVWLNYGNCSPSSCNSGYTASGNTCIVATTPDTTSPTITSFTIPSTSSSLSVPISSFMVSDNRIVTGYFLSESSTTPNASSGSWASSAPSIYTFINEGIKNLYAWAKDGAGNVSASVNDSTTITVPTTQTIKIVGVTASAYQDTNHLPEKTLDRVFSDTSYWAADGDGQWITYELNQTSTISYLKIAFYSTSQRYFEIQYSTNGTTWTNATSRLTSAGNMANQYQTFSFTPVDAKYIRILGHGSSAPSLWNSIVETDINGFAIDLPTTPTCTPESSSTTCSGKCGTQTNNCGGSVGCGDCGTGEICSSGTCVPNNLTYNPANYNIILSNDFEDNSLGGYLSHPDEWEDDWDEEWNWFKNNDIVSIVQQDDTKAMRFVYPEGTVNGEDQGTDFECSNCMGDADGKIEMYLSWNVMWKPGFDFVISGKVSGGIRGGDEWYYVGPPYYDDGYRVQLSWINAQWNQRGVPYFYIYHHDQVGDSGDSFPFYNPDYPESVYYFDTSEEKWTNFVLRIVLNSVNEYGEPGNYDGFVEGYIDGKFSVRKDGLRLRNVDSIGLDNLMIYSQFGGVGSEFATTADEWLLTDDYYVWTYSDEYLSAHPEVPRGRQLSPAGRTIVVPGMKN